MKVLLKTAALLAINCIFQNWVAAQTSETSISSLVKFLSRAPSPIEAMGMESGCPDYAQDRHAAIALAQRGESAIPEIEKKLGFDANQEPPSMGSFDHVAWLLYAYARIGGTGASQQIRSHAHSLPGPAWDRAMALLLSLTSYVSESHSPPALRMSDGRIFFCRPQEPRDALDQLISSWQRNDRKSFEATLGPSAATTLNAMLDRRTWPAMRSTFWHHREPNVAIGYSFSTPGRWSEPEEALKNELPSQSALEHAGEFEIDTTFTNGSGKECGRRGIRFVSMGVPAAEGSLLYRVDVLDIDRLLALLDACVNHP
jgi:hypothetical protein